MEDGTLFKFTKPPDGFARRVMFYTQPSWDELADKIHRLYGVPKDKVGVSYLDVDGDEITLSSQEELQDYYKFNLPMLKGFGQSGNAMKAIRFTVRDLSVVRDSDANKPLPRTPSLGSNLNENRNTFGVANQFPNIFDTADDWEAISAFPAGAAPNIFIPMIPEESPAPHAFLEPVESDAASTVRYDDKDTASSVTETDAGTQSKADKGKQRAIVEDASDDEDGAASTVSMVASNSPEKPPIHVASHVGSEDTFGVRRAAEPPVTVEATPKPAAKEVIPDVDDPPLPELEDIQAAPSPNTSLANDVARLLTTFSSVLATHPELSEGVRNIVRNATNGAYWAAHREAVARAADEVRRNAEQSVHDARRVAEEAHRAAEEAAGRRVAEALGGIVRTINQYTGQAAPATEAPTAEAATTNEGPVTSTPVTVRHVPEAPQRRPNPPRRPTWRHSWFGPAGPRSDSLDPHFEPFFSNEGDMHRPSRTMFFPPPPPPPPPSGLYGVPPPPPHASTLPPHPFPPPPMPGHPMPGAWPPAFATGYRSAWGADASASGAAAQAEPAAPSQQVTERELSAKEALQAAKEKYKAEKERYRRERELRRLHKSRVANSSSEAERYARSESSEDDGDSDADDSQPLLARPSDKKDEPDYTEIKGPIEPDAAGSSAQTLPEEPPSQIVSNARGGFPQLEMFSLSPRRHHTIHTTGRHGHHGHHAQSRPGYIYPPPPPPPLPVATPPSVPPPPPPPPPPSNPFVSQMQVARLSQSITHRLADMGITSTVYPTLPSKVHAQVSRLESARKASGDSDVSRDAEDSVVAEIVEELLSAPSPGPSAAGNTSLRRSNTTAPGS